MPLLAHVRISPIDDNHIAHQVTIDGERIPNVSRAVVEYEPNSIPVCTLEVNSVYDIDEDMIARLDFTPQSYTECMKYLWLKLQLDDEAWHKWSTSIANVLKGARENNLSDISTANAIIEQIFK